MHDGLIDLQALIAEIMRRGIYPPGVRHAIENAPAIDVASVRHEIEVLKRLLNGEWIDTKEVQNALGIDFKEGLKRFDFSRTSEWWSIVGKTEEERARKGQKTIICFKLKEHVERNAPKAVHAVPVVHGRWIAHDMGWVCSKCGEDAMTDGDYRQVMSNYCPKCGARMDGDINETD